MNTKICIKCKKEKNLSKYYFRKDRNKYRNICKECSKKHRKEYYQNNRNKVCKQRREYYQNNRNKICKKSREYYKKIDKINKEKIIKIHNEYKKNRRKNNLNFRLNERMSTAIGKSLKYNKNGHHWESLVGYTHKQLKRHLEKQFSKNMNWNNYGSYWHIDHIIPISEFKFDKSEDLQFKECWALNNLRPLEKMENIKKGNKLIKPYQKTLKI